MRVFPNTTEQLCVNPMVNFYVEPFISRLKVDNDLLNLLNPHNTSSIPPPPATPLPSIIFCPPSPSAAHLEEQWVLSERHMKTRYFMPTPW